MLLKAQLRGAGWSSACHCNQALRRAHVFAICRPLRLYLIMTSCHVVQADTYRHMKRATRTSGRGTSYYKLCLDALSG